MTDEIGAYLNENCATPPPDEREVRRLVVLARRGHAHVRRWARSRLVESNMRLVASRAKRFMYSGIPYRDLMQRGTIGLMRAIDLYDEGKGAKLSTYAAMWIDAEIQRYVDVQRSTIRQPVYRRREMARVTRARHRLAQRTGREPTAEELADATGVDADEIDLLRRTGFTLSLDEVLCGPGGAERIELTAAEDLDVEAAAEVAMLWTAVSEELAKLADLDERIPRVILEHYVGGRSFAELAEEFGVSRQRVGQIKERAVALLRAYLRGDDGLAETWRTRDCRIENGGPTVTKLL